MEFYREVNLMEFSDDVIQAARYHIKNVDTDLARRQPAVEREVLHKKREYYLQIINAAERIQDALMDLQSVSAAPRESSLNRGRTKGKTRSGDATRRS
jgi:hypothetical protein